MFKTNNVKIGKHLGDLIKTASTKMTASFASHTSRYVTAKLILTIYRKCKTVSAK